jgi:cullin 1
MHLSFSQQSKMLFLSKKLRINLNVPLKAVEQKDIEGVHRTTDEDRKMVIQAAIVRIMKARQTLKHALLMQEVIQQLSSHFRPEIPVIKVKLYPFIILIQYHLLYSRNVLTP